MFTPQQIQEISFETVRKGGYDMESVDNVLEPLTQDYLTLYKENSVLKSKLRILVEKLEEYRGQENSMQNAILAAQKTSEQMIADTEKKCAKMLREAEQTANSKKSVQPQIDAEDERLQTAKKASKDFIDSMEKRLKRQLELLDELRKLELPEKTPEERRAFDFDKEPSAPSAQEKADAIIEEIGLHIEQKLSTGTLGEIGGAEKKTDEADTAKLTMVHTEFQPPQKKKFEDLQFGKNYHPED